MDRPACPSGGRYCEILGTSEEFEASRVDLLEHSISSADRSYANLSSEDLPVVSVELSIVRDSVEPLRVIQHGLETF